MALHSLEARWVQCLPSVHPTLIALEWFQPANFLDGGGGANIANARLAIETLNRDPDVKSIFVNSESDHTASWYWCWIPLHACSIWGPDSDRVSVHCPLIEVEKPDWYEKYSLGSLVAEGIIEAVKENDIKKPIIVRVLGTGAERARQLVSQHDDPTRSED
jgi:succinyl-CoA synthetase beta subunit